MTTIKILNLVGIAFDIVGALLMYFPVPHPSSQPQNASPMHMMSLAAEYIMAGKKRDKRNVNLIRVGVGLLCLGFIFQFASAYLS